MPSPPETPRTAMSEEAEAWLVANPSTPRPPLTSETAAAVRAATRAGFEPAIAAVRAEFSVTESDITVGGQRCLEVRGGARDDAVVLYFYGGGHTVGSPEEDLVISAPLAAALEGRVVAPRYPLAPESPFPAALECAVAIYDALVDDVGADRIVVAGESAGGNLSLALALHSRDTGRALPAALALLSPWADLTHGGDSHHQDRDPTLVLAGGELDRAAAHYYGTNDPTDPLISPIHGDFTGLPPTLITTGTRDLLLSDCVRISTAMRADGVSVDLRVAEGMWHVFEFYRELPEARASMAEVCAFVAAHLG